MTHFTKREIAAEHRRRRNEVGVTRRDDRDYSVASGNSCIHCGLPLGYLLPAGQDAGLCDSCLSQDD